jgi:hypothetical protein
VGKLRHKLSTVVILSPKEKNPGTCYLEGAVVYLSKLFRNFTNISTNSEYPRVAMDIGESGGKRRLEGTGFGCFGQTGIPDRSQPGDWRHIGLEPVRSST